MPVLVALLTLIQIPTIDDVMAYRSSSFLLRRAVGGDPATPS